MNRKAAQESLNQKPFKRRINKKIPKQELKNFWLLPNEFKAFQNFSLEFPNIYPLMLTY